MREKTLPDPKIATDLWKSAALAYASTAENSELSLRGVFHEAEAIITRPRAASLEDSTAARDFSEAALSDITQTDFLRMGPAARLEAFRASGTPKDLLLTFCQAGQKLNALKSIRCSIPCFSSALRCYFSFCELTALPASPVSERAILLRGAIFNDGKTFGNYLNFVRKACFFLSEPAAWFSNAVINTVRGIRSAGKGEFRFPNFIRSELVIRVINFEPFGIQFAQLAFCAYLFGLRVPPEALQLRRSFSSDSLDLLSHAKDEELISARASPSGPQLTLRLAYRKNLPTGCVLYRPCFCDIPGASPKLHGLRPVHVWWAHVFCRVGPGRILFTEVNQTNINRVIKTVFAKLELPHAASYTSHVFRRGAAQELKERGGQWTTVAGLGGWRSLAFRGYVDTTADISQAMAKLPIEDFNPDESDEEERAFYSVGANPPPCPLFALYRGCWGFRD